MGRQYKNKSCHPQRIVSLILRILRLILIFLFGLFFVLPLFFRGAPFNRSSRQKVKKMIELAGIKAGQRAADLGSGDGRLVIALARAGAEAHGYEINPFLVWLSRYRIKKAGLFEKVFIHWQNFWNVDLSSFDIITIFQIDMSMSKLEDKLKNELKNKSRVISNYWTMPTWLYRDKIGKVYLYEK